MKYVLVINDIAQVTATDSVRLRSDVPFATISVGDHLLGTDVRGSGSGLLSPKYLVVGVEHSFLETPEIEHLICLKVMAV